MKLAIHKSSQVLFFSERWIQYCDVHGIDFKIVNCYSTDIIEELAECDGLLWHFSHAHPIDYQMSMHLVAALEAAGKKVFPNLNACWHFDDKVAQKYLLEAIQAPLIPSYVFYTKKEALAWVHQISYPIVFKLKGGAGSANVRLINSLRDARKYIDRAFGSGFRQFNRVGMFRDSVKQRLSKQVTTTEVLKNLGKIFVKSNYEKVKGHECGYLYAQDFLPNNQYDIRAVVIGTRAFAIKRMVRQNDFRASGSGNIIYGKKHIDERCIEIAFHISQQLGANCLTFDFLYDEQQNPQIAEISYGFAQEAYDGCDGYWDVDMEWYRERFVPQHWMVDDLVHPIGG